MFKSGVFASRYFPAFWLNTVIYSASHHIQPKCRKIRTRQSYGYGQFSCSVNYHNYQTTKNYQGCSLTKKKTRSVKWANYVTNYQLRFCQDEVITNTNFSKNIFESIWKVLRRAEKVSNFEFVVRPYMEFWQGL